MQTRPRSATPSSRGGAAPASPSRSRPRRWTPSGGRAAGDRRPDRSPSARGGQPAPVRDRPGRVPSAWRGSRCSPQDAQYREHAERDGPWGWFRLLDRRRVRSTNVSDRKRIIFNVGGRTAIFRMQVGLGRSIPSPFRPSTSSAARSRFDDGRLRGLREDARPRRLLPVRACRAPSSRPGTTGCSRAWLRRAKRSAPLDRLLHAPRRSGASACRPGSRAATRCSAS